MTPIRYSQSKPSPREALELFRHTRWAAARRLPEVRRALAHSGLVFCAREDGRLVGLTRVVTDFAFRAVLYDVIVHPDCHRRGIGSRLVRMALSHPRLKSVDQVWLYTTDKQAFYRTLGFKRWPENVMILKRGRA